MVTWTAIASGILQYPCQTHSGRRGEAEQVVGEDIRRPTKARSVVQITMKPTIKLPAVLMISVPYGNTGPKSFGCVSAQEVVCIGPDDGSQGYSEEVEHDGVLLEV